MKKVQLVTVLNFNGYGLWGYGYREMKFLFGHMVAVRWTKNVHLVIRLRLPMKTEYKQLVNGYNRDNRNNHTQKFG